RRHPQHPLQRLTRLARGRAERTAASTHPTSWRSPPSPHASTMISMRATSSFGLLCLALSIAACGGDADAPGSSGSSSGSGGNGSGTAPTWWEDVAPIVYDNCLDCHREGGIAPLGLESYEQASAAAALMKIETEARRMPPWHA